MAKNVKIRVQGNLEPAYLLLLVALAAAAIWSTVPLTIRLFTTMKRRSGLYFYAILLTSWGITVRQIGVLTLWFIFTPNVPWVVRRTLIEAGSIAMVSGFSVVLYSRLSLIILDHRIRRAVLGMILCNGIVWHVTVIINNAGIRYLKNRGREDLLPPWQRAHDPVEKTQVVIFSAQEIMISFFYVRAAYRYLKSQCNTPKSKARNAMCLLLCIQVIIITLDITLIVLDLAGYLKLKVFIHSFVYSVKLELEFVVLNQLIEISRMGLPGIPSASIKVADRTIRTTPRTEVPTKSQELNCEMDVEVRTMTQGLPWNWRLRSRMAQQVPWISSPSHVR